MAYSTMLTIVVSRLVLMRAWSVSELLSSSADLWEEWELRGAVSLSLTLQIVLLLLGNRRKRVPRAWITVLTWSAYILADSVAAYALGLISNLIGEFKADKSMDPHAELSTFWAPFLLLHLGCPDTISAYSIEDNELWLRHSVALLNQTGLTVYVLLMAWAHPSLLLLAVLILLLGFYKYGERVWVLHAASNEHFKDSHAECQSYSNNTRENNKFITAEGRQRHRPPHHVIRMEDLMSDPKNREYNRNLHALVAACSFVDTCQHLFADQFISLEKRDACLFILHDWPSKDIFQVIGIELGLMYDVFYAKAKAVYTRWGFISRLTIFSLICVVLVIFSSTDKQIYSKPDIFLTFLLLGVAVFLELYALFHILFSDRFACWLIKNKQSAVLHFVDRIQPLSKRRRWSNSIGQYSLMTCYKENDTRCWRFLKLLSVDEMAMKFLYQGREDLTGYIKDLILLTIAGKEQRDARQLPSSWIDRGGHVLNTHGHLEWSIKLEFGMSILVWHIATELCYYPDNGNQDSRINNGNQDSQISDSYPSMSLHLSRYMLYLLVMHPSMLPLGIGSIRFRDIYKEIKNFSALDDSTPERTAREGDPGRREYNPDIAKACHVLRALVRTKFNKRVTMPDKVKCVLCHGCQLASDLGCLPITECQKWVLISQVWAEMLIYAASKCKAMDHAQQMRRGGELITLVWFLLAHHGLTDHFQIYPAVADIVADSAG